MHGEGLSQRNFYFVHNIAASMRAYNKGSREKMGGRVKHKTVGNEDIRRSIEGRGMGWGKWVNKMDNTGTFRKESRDLNEVGLGWINGGREDRGFGWGKIRDGTEQLF